MTGPSDITFTRDHGGHTVWCGAERIGRVTKQAESRYLAIAYDNKILGTSNSMTRAGERLTRYYQGEQKDAQDNR